jgi:hypothetical protein
MQLMPPRSAEDTYRYLRIGIPALLGLLAAAIIDQIVRTEPDCWLGSISAYYYTSARAVFVACLCAIGACLIIYRGNTYRWRRPRRGRDKDDFEDFFLNVSGFLAFVVALVPTPLKGMDIRPGGRSGGEPVCRRSNVPSETQLTDALDNNILALLIAATLVLVVALSFNYAKARSGGSVVSVSSVVFIVGLAACWALHLGKPEFVRQHAHIGAATTMFLGIVVVVLLNTRGAATRYKVAYGAISAVLVLAIVVLGSMWRFGNFDHVVFWLEATVIALFGVFWLVQTVELWPVEQRSDL